MNRIFIGLMVCFLSNCSKRNENVGNKNKPYIISYEDKKNISHLKKHKIPPPPKGFYGESQLVIDKKGDLYYYQKKYTGIDCGTGRENDTFLISLIYNLKTF